MISKLSNALNKITEYLLGLLGITLFVIVFYGVLSRYIFGTPVAWSHELSTVLLIWVSFLGASYALKSQEHIKFDFIVDRLSSNKRHVIETFTNLTIILFFVMGTFWSYDLWIQNYHKPFQTLPITHAWFYSALPVSFLMMIVHALDHFLSEINKVRSNM